MGMFPFAAGARGGRGEFSWDNVKSDKDREFYLGHSVKAATGRWQKGAFSSWAAPAAAAAAARVTQSKTAEVSCPG